jgi:hypothetical protein
MSRKRWSLLVLLCLGSIPLQGAISGPIKNYPSISVKRSLSRAQVASALRKALLARDWRIDGESDGSFLASFSKGRYRASVEITYGSSKVSLKYQSSQNMAYDAGKGRINQQYNIWVSSLEKSIEDQL